MIYHELRRKRLSQSRRLTFRITSPRGESSRAGSFWASAKLGAERFSLFAQTRSVVIFSDVAFGPWTWAHNNAT